MRRKNKKLIQIIAIVLAILLAGGVVVGALFSALAETAPRDRFEIEMQYMPDEQALHVVQRLIYVNRSDDRLDRVVFYAEGNLFRRQSALMYEADDLERVFPNGFVPGGIDLQEVRLDGKPTEFGFQGEEETALRVACDLAPGEEGAFEFEYYLLLVDCGAFLGAGETDVRLSAFCFIPGVYDETYGEFRLNAPLAHTRWLYSESGDYQVTFTLPEAYAAAGSGAETIVEKGSGQTVWRFEAENIREFAVSFGKRWREERRATASGVELRALSNVRGGNDRILDTAERAIRQCEVWFGDFPMDQLDLVQSDYPLDAMNYPGLIWLPGSLLEAGGNDALEKAVRFCVAQQYFGLAAYAEPSADAWLSDSVSEYIAFLLLEEAEGRDAFLKAANREWVDALQLTIPGGLTVTSDARLFDRYSYDVVVRSRGAVVMHELREAMGREQLLAGLAEFYRMGQGGATLTEMDFVSAMDATSGGSWEDFLTDWVFNVGDYINQTIVWFE